MSAPRQLTPVEVERLIRARRRSVVVAGVGFTAVMAALVVVNYGFPWSWTTPGGATPWFSLVITLLVIGGYVAIMIPITRDRLGSPGPRRDLVVSGDLRDILRVVCDLGTGRRLDEHSRPVGRALVATNRRRMTLALVSLILGIVVGVLGTTVFAAAQWYFVTLAVLYVVGSLGVLAWSVSARRHSSAQGLEDPAPLAG